MNSFLQWFSQLQWDVLINMVLSAAACLLCIVLHELCHGWAALCMGDETALRAGRLTLNPLKHIDWVGLLLLITVHFGWAKPVPVNMRRFRRPKLGMALTALAGPAGNLLLALALTPLYTAAFVYDRLYGGGFGYLSYFLIRAVTVSIGLAVFNLLPVPPLDGSTILFTFLPDKWHRFLLKYERYGMFLLMALLYCGALDAPLSFLRNGILQFMFTVAGDPVVRLLLG